MKWDKILIVCTLPENMLVESLSNYTVPGNSIGYDLMKLNSNEVKIICISGDIEAEYYRRYDPESAYKTYLEYEIKDNVLSLTKYRPNKDNKDLVKTTDTIELEPYRTLVWHIKTTNDFKTASVLSKEHPSTVAFNLLEDLENIGCKMVNDIHSIVNTSDKVDCSVTLKNNNIPIPPGFNINIKTWTDNNKDILDRIKSLYKSSKLVVKIPNGSEGVGVMLLDSYSSFKSVVDLMFSSAGILDSVHALKLRCEMFLNTTGDYRLYLVCGKPFKAIYRAKSEDDFRSNGQHGSIHTMLESIPKPIYDIGCEIAKIYKGNLLAIDIVKTEDNKYYVLEINSMPGTKALGDTTTKEMWNIILNNC